MWSPTHQQVFAVFGRVWYLAVELRRQLVHQLLRRRVVSVRPPLPSVEHGTQRPVEPSCPPLGL
jgi:hypothetical protein